MKTIGDAGKSFHNERYKEGDSETVEWMEMQYSQDHTPLGR